MQILCRLDMVVRQSVEGENYYWTFFFGLSPENKPSSEFIFAAEEERNSLTCNWR